MGFLINLHNIIFFKWQNSVDFFWILLVRGRNFSNLLWELFFYFWGSVWEFDYFRTFSGGWIGGTFILMAFFSFFFKQDKVFSKLKVVFIKSRVPLFRQKFSEWNIYFHGAWLTKDNQLMRVHFVCNFWPHSNGNIEALRFFEFFSAEGEGAWVL